MMTNVYIAVVHHPVYDKNRQVISTCISNYDIHDISRTARCYGIKVFYVINPLPSQIILTQRIIEHWVEGYGARYNPTRKEALETVLVKPSLDDVKDDIARREGKQPKTVVTSRKPRDEFVAAADLRAIVETSPEPFLILFGTGWGLTDEMTRQADYYLEPIMAGSDYNHLSVRGAAAIVLDRILGDRLCGGKENA
jgi:hypothetical protein